MSSSPLLTLYVPHLLPPPVLLLLLLLLLLKGPKVTV
jgi:hypothetical protein